MALCVLVFGSDYTLAAVRDPLVPTPSVEGPIAVTAQSHPFLGSAWANVPVDLSRYGYVEEEFFVRGRASVYRYGPNRQIEVLAADAPYTNRILVRRPRDPKRFNGLIVVDLLNASSARDVSYNWPDQLGYLLDNGYGYVAVTSKPIAVAALKAFDPARYAALSWANPLPPSQRCPNPGPPLFSGWSTPETEDGLLWDIAAQTGALLRSDGRDNPFHGHRVQAIYLVGHSQSGAYVAQYARDFQPILRLANGKPVFDGFLQTGSSGLSMINQCTPALPYSDPHVAMRSATPLIRIMNLTDFYHFGPIEPYLQRRADSDQPGDLFRLYEMAGAEHVSAEAAKYNASDADQNRSGYPPDLFLACVQTTPSDFPHAPILNAALEHLDQWRRGMPPPHATRIVVDRPGAAHAQSVLDSDGNVQGGARSPAIDVPIASYGGKSTPLADKPETGCNNQGYKVPFTPARLKELYPTHAEYVAKVRASVARLRQQRWLTDWDAHKIIAAAEAAAVP